MDILFLALGTVALRPYFAVFLASYLFACSFHLGIKRALLFAASGYCIAWFAEYSSVHNGIPFGSYYYIPETEEAELWVLGVPFMDSMSFVFLSYSSYSLALFAMTPSIRTPELHFLESRKRSHSFGVRLLGAVLCVGLDVIIDPVALQGDRWFLGRIYGYPLGGSYFGVPLANFVGWFVVAYLLILALQRIDRALSVRNVRDISGNSFRWRYLPGIALYFGVAFFNLVITLLIGEYLMFGAGILIVIAPVAALVLALRRRSRRMASGTALREHLGDYPQAVIPGGEVAWKGLGD